MTEYSQQTISPVSNMLRNHGITLDGGPMIVPSRPEGDLLRVFLQTQPSIENGLRSKGRAVLPIADKVHGPSNILTAIAYGSTTMFGVEMVDATNKSKPVKRETYGVVDTRSGMKDGRFVLGLKILGNFTKSGSFEVPTIFAPDEMQSLPRKERERRMAQLQLDFSGAVSLDVIGNHTGSEAVELAEPKHLLAVTSSFLGIARSGKALQQVGLNEQPHLPHTWDRNGRNKAIDIMSSNDPQNLAETLINGGVPTDPIWQMITTLPPIVLSLSNGNSSVGRTPMSDLSDNLFVSSLFVTPELVDWESGQQNTIPLMRANDLDGLRLMQATAILTASMQHQEYSFQKRIEEIRKSGGKV